MDHFQFQRFAASGSSLDRTSQTSPPTKRLRTAKSKPHYTETGYVADCEDVTYDDVLVFSQTQLPKSSASPEVLEDVPSNPSPVCVLQRRAELIQAAADKNDALAKTLLEITAHFKTLADAQARHLDEVTVFVQESKSALTLYEILQLFQDQRVEHDSESCSQTT